MSSIFHWRSGVVFSSFIEPVLYTSGECGNERPLRKRLLLDLIYRPVLRMKTGDAAGEVTAPGVFIVNLSLGDRNRPFAGPMSPWGRLLDYLADRFVILFLVSAGNLTEPPAVRDFAGLIDFENASAKARGAAILCALAEQQAVRTLLSPAESLNAVTVGAWHEDGAPPMNGAAVFSSFADKPGSNISSDLQLGQRKVVKPDIFMPGGRKLVRVAANDAGDISLRIVPPGRLYGLRFDMICEANGIAHRLTKPNQPWTNGQVERMNRMIKDATVKRFCCDDQNPLRTHLSDFIAAYNFARRLKTLGGLTPDESNCKIWTSEPNRYVLNPIHQMPGLNRAHDMGFG